jgi:hypothetical protein
MVFGASAGGCGVAFAVGVIIVALILRASQARNFIRLMEFTAFAFMAIAFLCWLLLNEKSPPVSDWLAAGALSVAGVVVSLLMLVLRGKLDG